MAKANITHREIVEQILRKDYKPIYLLMGEEAYYIDRIAEYIADNVLTKDEQDFNQTVVYCTRETAVADVVNCARRYPMMAKFQVVIVKEAQNLLKIDELATYAQNPMPSTILVICYKNGKVDGRKKLVPAVEKVGIVFESAKLKEGMLPQFIADYLRRKQVGIVFESPKLKEGMLPQFIADYLRRKQITIEERACLMMAESVGSDLNRLAGELDKLVLALPTGQTRITTDLVQGHVGVSKEFNVWELRTAIANKDIAKANKIMYYMEQNVKSNPPVMTVSTLFNFFALLMQAWYSPERTEQGLMKHLEFRQTWQLREYTTAIQSLPTKSMKS